MTPNRRRSPRSGFTLVEVLIVTLILGIFLTVAYSIFFGGQRVAGKAAWLQYTAADLRQAEQVITKALQTTSYPSTLLPTKVIDAGGTTAVPGPNSAAFYVRIPGGLGKKSAATLLGLPNRILLSMVRCSPEKQGFAAAENRVGSLTFMLLRLEKSREKADQGTLIYEERATTYSTSAPDYSAGLVIDPINLQVTYRMELVKNVEFITIDAVPGHAPSKVTITIATAYPRDAKVTREGSSAAVPNVGVFAAP